MKIQHFFIAVLFFTSTALSCTIFNFKANNDYFVARTFDWMDGRIAVVQNKAGGQNQSANAGMQKHPAKWRVKYASVTLDMVQKNGLPNRFAVVDGMNSAGLQAAILELGATQYPQYPKKPTLASAMWVAYLLDQASNVSSAIALTKKVDVVPTIYDGVKVPLHIMLNDASGHAAVMEYINGKLIVYSGKNLPLKLLTNTIYPQALKEYQASSKNSALPAGYHSVARFVRAGYLLKTTKPQNSSQAFQILQAVAEPKNSEDPTQWSIVFDLTKRVAYLRKASGQEQTIKLL